MKENRKFRRFSHEEKIKYDFYYDVITKIRFLCKNRDKERLVDEGHQAFLKNISAEGLCFVSDYKMEKGDTVDLKVYLPSFKDTVSMEGEVKWQKEVSPLMKIETETKSVNNSTHPKFDTGVKLISVEGKSVLESLYFDEKYHIAWSAVLDAVLGKYRLLAQKNQQEEIDSSN